MCLSFSFEVLTVVATTPQLQPLYRVRIYVSFLLSCTALMFMIQGERVAFQLTKSVPEFMPQTMPGFMPQFVPQTHFWAHPNSIGQKIHA